MVSCALSGVQMRPRTNRGHSLSRLSVPLLPKPQAYAKNSYGVDMTDEQAVQFGEAFFVEYDGLRAWHEIARAAANDPEVTEVRTHRINRRQHLPDAAHWWSKIRFTGQYADPRQ